ncbi:MAG: DUF4192 domain-containing protein [Gordonia polyisoprenivorans]|nr:DUF4192 domain-containing protein [Gordonia polyisoprenivorans]
MTIRITTAADLVASIPALLGFVPTESMVMVVLRGERVLFTARHDLAAITNGHDAATLAETIAANGAERVLLIGISDEPSIVAHTEMVGHLAGYAIDVHRQIHVSTCEHATEYIDYATGETGMTRDYRDSAVTAHTAVEHGQAVRASRKDFAAMFATTTEAAPVDPQTIDPAQVARDMAAAVTANTDPGPELAAQFGALIGDVKKRDAMLRLGISQTGTAAVVMARTAAHLRSHARARVLALAMYFFYVAGNGAAAGIAADTVTDEGLEPTSFMQLLDRSLRAAMHPDGLSDLMPTQEDASTYLGAPFPI